MLWNQHSQATPVHLDVGDSVMKRAPDRSCKITLKFLGPFLLTAKLLDHNTNVSEVVHVDRLKKVNASFTSGAVPSPPSPTDLPSPPDAHLSHSYRLNVIDLFPPLLPLFPCKVWGQASFFLYFLVFFNFGLPPLGTHPFLGAYALIFLYVLREDLHFVLSCTYHVLFILSFLI